MTIPCTSTHRRRRLRRARELAGLSMAQAAKLLGWDRRTLVEFEIDGRPTGAELQQFAEMYRVPVAYLEGADLEITESFRAMLDKADVTFCERDALLEFAGILALHPPQSGARDRIAAVSAKHADAAPETMPPRAAKVRYVKAQGQTRTHHCHWPGCEEQVPPAMWGCKAHWFRLPKALRDRIWTAYRPGQERDMTPSEEYLQVADDVQRWIREQEVKRERELEHEMSPANDRMPK